MTEVKQAEWIEYIADIEEDGKEYFVYLMAHNFIHAIERVMERNPKATLKGIRIDE